MLFRSFRDLMTDLVPIHAQVRGLHGDPVEAAATAAVGATATAVGAGDGPPGR